MALEAAEAHFLEQFCSQWHTAPTSNSVIRLVSEPNLAQSPGKVESLGKGATMVPAEAGKKLAAAMTATKGTQPESGNV